MSGNKTIIIEVSKEHKAFIKQEIESGNFVSENDVILEALKEFISKRYQDGKMTKKKYSQFVRDTEKTKDSPSEIREQLRNRKHSDSADLLREDRQRNE